MFRSNIVSLSITHCDNHRAFEKHTIDFVLSASSLLSQFLYLATFSHSSLKCGYIVCSFWKIWGINNFPIFSMDYAVWKEITIFRLRNVHSVGSNLQNQVKFRVWKKALYEGRLISNAHSEIFCRRSKVAMRAQCGLVATTLLHSGAKFHFLLYTGSKTVRVNME